MYVHKFFQSYLFLYNVLYENTPLFVLCYLSLDYFNNLYNIVETVVLCITKTCTGAFLVALWGSAKDFQL